MHVCTASACAHPVSRAGEAAALSVSRRADAPGVCGCAGIKLTANNGTVDKRFAYLINVFKQNIVFEDSVLEGLAPRANESIILVLNSTVSFVRLTVKSCILTGPESAVFNLGTFNNTKPEALTITDSSFIRNQGKDYRYLVWQNSGKLLISNTQFIGNTASKGGQVLSEWSGIPHPAYRLTLHGCTFRNNIGGTNGCIYVNAATRVEMSDCTFENNRGVDRGGLGGALQVLAPHHLAPNVETRRLAAPYRTLPVGWGRGSTVGYATFQLAHVIAPGAEGAIPPAEFPARCPFGR
jgi:hypothetical protein